MKSWNPGNGIRVSNISGVSRYTPTRPTTKYTIHARTELTMSTHFENLPGSVESDLPQSLWILRKAVPLSSRVAREMYLVKCESISQKSGRRLLNDHHASVSSHVSGWPADGWTRTRVCGWNVVPPASYGE